MNLRNHSKIVAIIIIAAFCFAGCATPLFEKPSLDIGIEKKQRVTPPKIIVETEPSKPLVQQPLREGEVAPSDGILFDKESAQRILVDLTAYKGLKAEVQIHNQITEAYAQQIELLYEAIDLQAQANQELRKEIESQKKWATVRTVGTVLGTIALCFISVWAGK